jgi:hypothetical protein
MGADDGWFFVRYLPDGYGPFLKPIMLFLFRARSRRVLSDSGY